MAPDADGDWDGKLEVTWDAWSRITRVKNNGTVVGEYTYDGTHRRVTRELDEETLHSYYNSQWRPVEERKDAETTASISYLWGSRHRDDLVRRDRAVGGTTLNETRYILMDYFNPAAITDEAGEVTERYAFSAFGVRTILNPDFTVRGSGECAMEFGFQGQFLDIESGLMNYGFRYYSPQLGRWTCKDPIKEKGGANLYGMVANNPINGVDHLGLYANVNQLSELAGLLEATQKEVSMHYCGGFKTVIQWSFSKTVTDGAIMQLVQQYGKVTYCPSHPTNRGYDPIDVKYTEYWRVQKGQIIDANGRDTFQGSEKSCTSGYITYRVDATYIPGAAINLPPGQLPQAGSLPAEYGWRNINGATVSNTKPRIVTFYWDCCNGRKKTKWREGA